LFDVSLAGYFGRRQMAAPDHFGIFLLRFFQPSKVFLWDNQHVSGRFWINVFKRQNVFVLVNFVRWNFTAENTAEEAVNG
jgi:hypothetical protein